MTDRREFLKTAGRVSAALSLAAFGGPFRAALAQTAASAPLAAAPLRGRLALVTGAGGNVVVLDSGGRLALVDSGAPEQASSLAALLADRFDRAPVEAVFNTHWHLTNTGGNEAFRQAGAKILAHENTRLWMSTEFYVEWQDRTYSPRPAGALPTETFYSHEPQPKKLEFGEGGIEYGHLPEAHTDGDIYVFFPDENVVAAGGVVGPGTYPIVDYTTGGWIGGLADATKKLLDLADAETRIVPESGPVRDRAYLASQHEMLVTLRGRIEDLMRKGKSAAEMVAEGVTKEFDAQWGNDSALFVSNVYEGLWWGGRLGGAL